MPGILNRLLKPTRILHAGEYLEWLGFDVKKELPRAFAAEGLRCRGFSNGIFGPHFPTSSQPTPYDAELREIARYPICIVEEKLLPEIREGAGVDPEHWLGILRHEYFRIERIFDDFKPHAVILFQGYEPSNAIARLIAIKRDIPFITLENTALKDRMLWDDQSGITTNCNLAKNFFWRHRDLVLDGGEVPYIERIIAGTRQNKQEEHASPPKAFESGGDAGKKTILFIGQVYTDSSVLFGSGDWSSPVEIVRTLAELADESGHRLILKLHPKEISGNAPVTLKPYAKLTYRKILESAAVKALMDAGVDMVIDHENEFDTYSLIAQADVVVTMNSQTGLEASIRKVPTVVCGSAFYGGLDFTLDAPDPEILEIQVRKAVGMSAEDLDKRTSIARKFTYVYFEKYCRPKTVPQLVHLIKSRCLH